jgi:hypothetical protein
VLFVDQDDMGSARIAQVRGGIPFFLVIWLSLVVQAYMLLCALCSQSVQSLHALLLPSGVHTACPLS